MKAGDTVFVIHSTNNVISGVLGESWIEGAQGFYTRWGSGHEVWFRTASRNHPAHHIYNDENIFGTKEAARKELFTRKLRYPKLMEGRKGK